MIIPRSHLGDLLSEMLAQNAVEYVLGTPGGQRTALHDGISRRTDRTRHILMRDEHTAAHAADGYARLTGKPGACDVTVGLRANLLPAGFLEALNTSIPMVGIIGELPLDWLPLKEIGIAGQRFDQLSFFKTCSKEAFLVPLITAFPDLIRTAFRIATAAALIRKSKRPALADRLGGLVVISLSGRGSVKETRGPIRRGC